MIIRVNSILPSKGPIKIINYDNNSQPIANRAQADKVSFGADLKLAEELSFDQVLKLVRKLDKKTLNPEIQKDLKEILNDGERVVKYNFVLTALNPQQVVLGRPGLNNYQNANRTFVRTEASFGEVSGSGKSISEAIEGLVQHAKKGKLLD